MIKRYLDFIKESVSEIEKKHHSLGEWVEDLCENKEILELIKPYIDNTNPTVKISNTINTLDNNKKQYVYDIITDYLNDTGKETEVSTFVDFTNESVEQDIEAGQHVFKTFLKVITSLGLKDTKPSWSNLPDDYLLFFEYKCERALVLEKLERFTSLSMFKDKLPKENCYLYYGVKLIKGERKIDLNFNFGFKEDSQIIKIGSFKVNNSTFKRLTNLESPSSAHFRKELAHLTYDKLKLLGEVANHMKTYHPGDTEDKSFKVEDGVLEFGYKGLGKWTDGKMDNDEKDRLRKGFTEHLLKFTNKHKIEASVKPDEKSWVRLNVRIKKS